MTGPQTDHITHFGDIVQLIGEKNSNYIIRLEPDGQFQTHLGVIPHNELVEQPWGARIQTHLGKSFRILQPAFDDLIRTLNRNTQIMYPKDSGYVLITMGIGPGKTVIEAGTGSGALTIAMANLVGSNGHIYSYDVRPEHQVQARENIDLLSMSDRVTFIVANVVDGFSQTNVDALFLDLPDAHLVLPHVRPALKPGGFLGSLLPTSNQVSEMIDGLKKNGFEFIEVSELLHRYYKVSASRLRPADKMTAHTGYLVFARRMTSFNEMEHF
jgi:tRNA (adenine57-N1/adenine58-N1)-methyltransferase